MSGSSTKEGGFKLYSMIIAALFGLALGVYLQLHYFGKSIPVIV
jgi:hypothetical protein